MAAKLLPYLDLLWALLLALARSHCECLGTKEVRQTVKDKNFSQFSRFSPISIDRIKVLLSSLTYEGRKRKREGKVNKNEARSGRPELEPDLVSHKNNSVLNFHFNGVQFCTELMPIIYQHNTKYNVQDIVDPANVEAIDSVNRCSTLLREELRTQHRSWKAQHSKELGIARIVSSESPVVLP